MHFLPVEIWNHVFSFLPNSEVLKVRKVCHWWKNIVNLHVFVNRKLKLKTDNNKYIGEIQRIFDKILLDVYCDSWKNKNITTLSDVHTLDLGGCVNITDVSALSDVHTLNLSWCRNITDVSALGGVHTLDLSYCYKIIHYCI